MHGPGAPTEAATRSVALRSRVVECVASTTGVCLGSGLLCSMNPGLLVLRC